MAVRDSREPENFIVREARPSDLPRLAELLFQLSQDGERPESRKPGPVQQQEDTLRAMTRDARFSCVVIEHEGKLVGTVTLYVLPGLSHGGQPFGIVENVVVDEGARGLGFGRVLMDHVEALARERGCYKISFTSNRRRLDAHAFYDHLGYDATHLGFSKYFD